jgi:hypothetical protein
MTRTKKPKATPVIKLNELLENAINSIKLGIEDYELSATPGKESRAISAARNIYAGLLLLFKYRIGSLADTPEQLIELLYRPEKIQPVRNSSGFIEWRPTPHPKDTIDTGMIQSRLTGLGIYHDWNVVEKLRKCRNDLEHLHPKAPTTEIQRLIVDLFPMLQRFVHEELGQSPSELLEDAWESMVAVSSFYEETQKEALELWKAAGLPSEAWNFLSTCPCEACYSSLLQPLKSSIEARLAVDTQEFQYECISCKHTGSIVELFQTEFALSREDPFSETSLIRECNTCYIAAFSMTDEYCHWCGEYEKWPRCSICNSPVSEHTQSAGGAWCDRCAADEDMFLNS